MKAFVAILACVLGSTVQAELVEPPDWDAVKDADSTEVAVEKPLAIDTTATKAEDWTRAKNGVVGQFVQAPSLLTPINPLAKPEAGDGASNISRDPITGRIMGLHLIKLEF